MFKIVIFIIVSWFVFVGVVMAQSSETNVNQEYGPINGPEWRTCPEGYQYFGKLDGDIITPSCEHPQTGDIVPAQR